MTLYEKFKNLHIDFSSLGLEQGGSRSDYFCTPKGAKVIGCLNSYRASGAGGYPEYTRCPIVREINVEMSDLILDFFKSHPKLSLKTRRWFTVFMSP